MDEYWYILYGMIRFDSNQMSICVHDCLQISQCVNNDKKNERHGGGMGNGKGKQQQSQATYT